ncbi:hypothetical protein BHE74_00052981 [Ensete ventricosum]|nr:hypothetical protein BHE74_00052981 [Ensete ventricosum]
MPLAMPAVLVVRRALAGGGCRPYLCQVGCTTNGILRITGRPATSGWPRRRPSCPRGDDLAARSASVISFFPPQVDLLEAPDGGVEDELGNYGVSRVDPTEHELGNCNAVRVDPTEHELGNHNAVRVDPTEHELGNYNAARVDPTEHELGNYNAARVDPTERELGNYDVSRVDPTEHELGNCNAARVDPTEHELRNYDVGLLPRMESGANPEMGRSRAQIRRFGREGDLGRKSGDLADGAKSGANPEIWPRG